MLKPVHAYRTQGFRVVRGGHPIVAECGHIVGVAFGTVLKVQEDLKDSPSYDTTSRVPSLIRSWSKEEIRRLQACLGGVA